MLVFARHVHWPFGVCSAFVFFANFIGPVTTVDAHQSQQPEVLDPRTSAEPFPSQLAQSTTGSVSNGTIDTPVPKLQTDQEQEKQESEGKQTNRLFWVAPNFAAVSANTQLPPLSTRGKFLLAMHDSIDYSSFTWTAIIAGQSLALNSVPELGHGIAGYGRYYWRAYADGVSGTFFTEAIVPAITHEDPRYYTLGHGSF